jgi:class 3 adenylate cyclase/tetratricopeptide (TPR) repeat protein
VITCGVCEAENPEGFKFCGRCATSLQPTAAVPEERKVVTSLFCDLVAFTAMSEAADPEDVHALLGKYFAAARSAIEAFGGSVQKFIGDAVVGVFGVPAAHEDDPERAVRAGLRICEDVEGLTRPDGDPLQLRVGINTGEALVRLDVTPGSGEGFLTGDPVNTAARIQSVAPVMGVAVGRTTYEATKPVFEYVDLSPAIVKGKTDPVEVWHAVAPLARLGTDVTRRHDTPMVGREVDLALLKGVFDKTVASSSPQLVTIVGEPGLGKSRLVAELLAHIDAQPRLVTWRQGRCLPYGEGITFWALGEIVKAHAGILDTDAVDVAEKKLDAVLPEVEERAWLKQRLLPLLGVESTSQAEQGELFTAWRRFLESVAEQGPTVVVFEDLHWADPAMLTFVEHLADHTDGVALLIVSTTRPELLDDHPAFDQGERATRIMLNPLDPVETERLVCALLDTVGVSEDLRRPLVERAGGNPLFAEEYVRLLQDRDLVDRVDGRVQLRGKARVPLPDNVQALLAARLDLLPSDQKALLADAAVVGTTFWAGALAAMSGMSEDDVIGALGRLSRKELVRPVGRSTMAGQQEYTFWHVLTRDVAYGQLPRLARSTRHVAAARWLEDRAAGRVEDVSDVLAHHYVTALELARAVGDDTTAREVAPSAVRFLLLAGERAQFLDASSAYNQLAKAAALTQAGDPLRPRVVFTYGLAARSVGRLAEAQALLEEATESFRTAGDLTAAVEALTQLGSVLQVRGDPRWMTAATQAQDLVQGLSPGPVHANVFALLAMREGILGQDEAVLGPANRALELVDQLDLDPAGFSAVSARGWRGLARCSLGDPSGLDDLNEAIQLATTAGRGLQAAVFIANMGEVLLCLRGPAAALEVLQHGSAYCDARGLTEMADAMSMLLVKSKVLLGALAEVDRAADGLTVRLQTANAAMSLHEVVGSKVQAMVLRGESEQATDDLNELVAASRSMGVPGLTAEGVGAAALAHAALGHQAAALSLFTDLAQDPNIGATMDAALQLPSWVRALIALDDPALAEQFTASVPTVHTLGQHVHIAAQAALAESSGDLATALAGYADAGQRMHDFTMYVEEAFALLGQGRCLIALDRPDEAVPVLEQARDMFTKMGARPALAEVQALLAPLA